MHATDELRADRDVLLAAIRQDVQAAVFVPPDLKDDREIALVAYKKDAYALRFAPEECRHGDPAFHLKGRWLPK